MNTPFKLPTIARECKSCFYFRQGNCTGLQFHTAPGCEEKRDKEWRKGGGKK